MSKQTILILREALGRIVKREKCRNCGHIGWCNCETGPQWVPVHDEAWRIAKQALTTEDQE